MANITPINGTSSPAAQRPVLNANFEAINSQVNSLQVAVDAGLVGGGAVSSVAGRTGDVVLTKTDVGLAQVDNTSDAAKPVSTAQGTALAGKADLSGGRVLASQIPIATGSALGGIRVGSGLTVDGSGILSSLSGGGAVSSVSGRTGDVVLTKTDVGLANAENTSDAAKPISTATAAALAGLFTQESVATFSTAGQSNVTAPANAKEHTAFAVAAAGTGPYTRVVPLQATNSPAVGTLVRVVIDLPASSNPTIEVRDGTPAGPILLTITNVAATADKATAVFVYRSDGYKLASSTNVGSTSPGGASEEWATSSGASQALAFGALKKNVVTTLSANTTFTASGYAQGRQIDLFIKGGGSTYNLTFPAWRHSGSGAPASVAAGSGLLVRLKSEDGIEGNTWAEYISFGSAAAPIPALSYLGTASDETNLASYSFTSQPLGAADTTRRIVVAVATRRGGVLDTDVTSVAIGGVAATEVVQSQPVDSPNSGYVGLWQAAVPTGTTATIDVVVNGSASQCAIGIFRMVNTGSVAKATATLADGASGTTLSPLNVNVVPTDIVIGASTAGGATTDSTWTGLTEVLDTRIGTGSFQRISAATHTATIAETPRAISTTISIAVAARGAVVAVFGAP